MFSLSEAVATSATTIIEGRVLQLVPHSLVDGSAGWRGNSLHAGEISLCGSVIVPLNLDFEDVGAPEAGDEHRVFVFPSELLVIIQGNAWVLLREL